MAQRRCLRCQQRHRTDELIPLHLGAGGLLVVGRVTGCRGGWICPSCVRPSAERPGPLFRCFKSRLSGADTLPTNARLWLFSGFLDHLWKAQRHGLLIHPVNSDSKELAAVVFSEDASPPTGRAPAWEDNQPLTYHIPISSADLGAKLGRNACTAVGIKPGRSTQSLLRSLRGWYSVG